MIGEYSKAQGGERNLVRRAVLVFTGFYILMTVLLALLQGFFDFDMKHADSIAAVAVAGMLAGRAMVKRIGRMPEPEDFTKLRIGGTVAIFAVQIGFAYGLVKIEQYLGGSSLADLLGSMPVLIAAGLLLFLAALYYSAIGWSAKLGAKTAFDALPGAKEQEAA